MADGTPNNIQVQVANLSGWLPGKSPACCPIACLTQYSGKFFPLPIEFVLVGDLNRVLIKESKLISGKDPLGWLLSWGQ